MAHDELASSHILAPVAGGAAAGQSRALRRPAARDWAAMVYLVFTTVRSLIHLLSPDGGAQSIATIDVHVAGGANIVAMFG